MQEDHENQQFLQELQRRGSNFQSKNAFDESLPESPIKQRFDVDGTLMMDKNNSFLGQTQPMFSNTRPMKPEELAGERDASELDGDMDQSQTQRSEEGDEIVIQNQCSGQNE